MKIKTMLLMSCLLLSNSLLATLSLREHLPINYMLERYDMPGKFSNIRTYTYLSLDMYFPSRDHFQSMIEKYKSDWQEFSLNYETIIAERDAMLFSPVWNTVLSNFDFSNDYGNLSLQFKEMLKIQCSELYAALRISYSDIRVLSMVDSVKTSWKEGIELLRQTYSPEGNPQSLEDAVALVFLHIKPPRPYSPPMFDSLRSKLSQSYRSASESARSEHDRKEKEDFIFFMNCMAHAIGLIEQKDPLQLFGYDEVTDGSTSFSIPIPRTSSAESVESAGSSSSAGSSESSTSSSSSITCSEKSSSTSTSFSDPADTEDVVRRRK